MPEVPQKMAKSVLLDGLPEGSPESDQLNTVLLQHPVICKGLCSVFILICSCFLCPPLQGLAHQHHMNKPALQKALKSSIYARILAILPFTGCSGQRNSCLRNYSIIVMKGDKRSHKAAFFFFFKVPAPSKWQMMKIEISCNFSHPSTWSCWRG